VGERRPGLGRRIELLPIDVRVRLKPQPAPVPE